MARWRMWRAARCAANTAGPRRSGRSSRRWLNASVYGLPVSLDGQAADDASLQTRPLPKSGWTNRPPRDLALVEDPVVEADASLVIAAVDVVIERVEVRRGNVG